MAYRSAILGYMLSWFFSLCAFSIVFNPYVDIFVVRRSVLFPLLACFLAGRMVLNICKFTHFIGICNMLIIGGFIVFLFVFSRGEFFGVRYIVAVGCFLNFLVMAFNGGRMPVEKRALARRRVELLPDNPLHTIENETTPLKILDDRILAPLFSPTAMSAGDVVGRLGIFMTFVQIYLF